jgi:EmrB/QacA subfamily drug resistance transporter
VSTAARYGHTIENASPDFVDPRRWLTLVIVLTATLMAGLDTTILTVAIPTILRDFHTTLPQLQWAITGYSLTYGSMLIIGGRLSDIHGPRRIWVIGVSLFGLGSLVAALSTNVLMLVVGEGLFEGVGAALMAPASLAILTRTFHGRERGTAFSMWAAVMGAAVAFGPVLGGFLTTEYSWRAAFVINVVIVPFVLVGMLTLTPRHHGEGVKEPLDIPGAVLVASGMAMLVFSISQGSFYGWWRPLRDFTVAGETALSSHAWLSPAPIALVLSLGLLGAFVALERSKERRGAWPLFEFGSLRDPGLRWGLIAMLVVALGQVAFMIIISVVLQDANHFSALETGLWLVPIGVSIVVGSQIGGWITRRFDAVIVVRVGLGLEALGIALTSMVLGSDVTLMQLLPCFVLFGCGFGFAGAQLNNVILRDVPPEKAGSASGANAASRVLGGALGVAAISAIIAGFTVHYAVANLRAEPSLSGGTRRAAVERVHGQGLATTAPPGTSPKEVATVRAAVTDAIGSAADEALRFAAVMVLLSLAVSFRIPPEAATARAAAEAQSIAPSRA